MCSIKNNIWLLKRYTSCKGKQLCEGKISVAEKNTFTGCCTRHNSTSLRNSKCYGKEVNNLKHCKGLVGKGRGGS